MRNLEFSKILNLRVPIAKKIRILLLTAAVILPGVRCEELGKISGAETLILALFANASTGEFLSYTANKVAIARFELLVSAAGELKTSAAAYKATPNQTNLNDLRNKWIAARRIFKQGEVFYISRSYIPSNYFHRLDGYILGESFRPDAADLETIVAGTTPATINVSSVDTLSIPRKGFETLEYFLYDSGTGTSAIATVNTENAGSARTLDYIAALAEVIERDAQRLLGAWSPSVGNFAGNLSTGTGNFAGIRDAVDSFLNGTVQLIYTDQDVRVGVPAGLTLAGPVPLPAKVESKYSDNSYRDLLASVEGIELVYLGNAGDAEARPLRYLVQLQNESLDLRIKEKISTLKTRIQSRIDSAATLRADIAGNLSFVDEEIYDRLRELRVIYATEVIGVLGANALPSNSDGD
ncbi:imelysin [Leptospira gomenensis]|uniref:Imelysin n=1 Tax=Leptospira gomenensis TaxID=2484974 RepID=A0A5F1YE28_9LEPT|nr:imelysin family protein [Leptospira gomenensis]TGK34337.1 imelysin [Leptospira gomenensis]TGK37301.1 imelysin [Leptospira gomenensis]TGK50988.1 imelysin [Leptospira gomenensis]TGK56610.1 imelysin [Leptospira gomenensis]